MRKKAWRRGTTAVETAIVFPLLVLVTLGAIHYGWLFLKAQQITNAARMAVRMAVLPDATKLGVDNAVGDLFGPLKGNISDYTVTYYVTPIVEATGEPDIENRAEIVNLAQNSGDLITVWITVPRASVDFMNASLFPTPDELKASATMTKEGP